jgi:hypothetical protein
MTRSPLPWGTDGTLTVYGEPTFQAIRNIPGPEFSVAALGNLVNCERADLVNRHRLCRCCGGRRSQ